MVSERLLNVSYIRGMNSLYVDTTRGGQAIVVNAAWAGGISEWLEWLAAAGVSFETRRLRSKQLRRFGAARGGDPFDVQFGELIAFLANPEWSPGTRRSFHNAVKSFYKWATLTGKCATDPAAELPKVPVPPGKPRPAGELAIRQGLKVADDRVSLMLRLAAFQGLRAGEISRIHTRDVVQDLLGHSLRVHGKGGKERLVPLQDNLAAELRDREPGFVLPGQHDGHLSPAYVSKLISHALPPGITAHMLRHRFAGMAYKGTGNDLRAVQELLGHASVATTQIYTPVMPDALRLGVAAAS